MAPPAAALDCLAHALPRLFAGPGGACAVLRRGEVLLRHSWGWANAEGRIPFTPGTLVRICSVSKQFTSGLVLDSVADPDDLDGDVRAALPRLPGAVPGARHLLHNQSGLRDYWAVAMLLGAPAESAFGDADAARVVGATQSLHFAPGTRYSYCNQNFRILSDILQARSGRSFAELLRERIFAPAGMATATLAADTRAMPDGTEGYEGTQEAGFRPARNRILWTGDAGIGASLDDMIAWERWIDRNRDDPASLYNRLSVPVRFADGAAAPYGFGLSRRTERGRPITGHGGALRGWRTHRLHVAGERVSVVVLFNHMGDASDAAMRLLGAVLGDPAATPAPAAPMPPWMGAYLEPETGLSVRVSPGAGGQIRLQYDRRGELLGLAADGSAGSDGTRLHPIGDTLWMDRAGDNQSTPLLPCDGPGAHDVAGRYRCEELDAELTVADAGGVLYAAPSGLLGRGRMELLDPVGRDVWAMPCPRALDHTPPGDWTLHFHRTGEAPPDRLTVGCWLARRLDYVRVAEARSRAAAISASPRRPTRPGATG